MIFKMYSWLLLSFFVLKIYSIQIGQISNAALNLLSSSIPNIINGTKAECLCAMISSQNITAINYFSNNTCQLFSNQSIINANFFYKIDLNSSFYFLQLPIKAENLDCAVG